MLKSVTWDALIDFANNFRKIVQGLRIKIDHTPNPNHSQTALLTPKPEQVVEITTKQSLVHFKPNP